MICRPLGRDRWPRCAFGGCSFLLERVQRSFAEAELMPIDLSKLVHEWSNRFSVDHTISFHSDIVLNGVDVAIVYP